MERIIAEYISKKLINDIRKEHLPSPELSEAVRKFPLIDFMRGLVQPDDLGKIHLLLEADHEEVRDLGLSLLNNILKINDVRNYLEKLWQSPNLTFRDRNGILFTLLNYENLAPFFHEQFHDFIFGNWEYWLAHVAASYAGGHQAVLDYVGNRLQDKRFPGSKRWV